MNINFYMDKALDEANKALLLDEVPIGAVLVNNQSNKIITSAHNMVNLMKNSMAHAEILIINQASKILKNKFLKDTSLFITLEPCAMCAAAISEAHITTVYFGAYDEKKGSLDSIMKIYNNKNFFIPDVYGGINEIKCSLLLRNFFIEKRTK